MKTKEEFNLSKRIDKYDSDFIATKYVKEFIRRLKEELTDKIENGVFISHDEKMKVYLKYLRDEFIVKSAGDKLVEGKET